MKLNWLTMFARTIKGLAVGRTHARTRCRRRTLRLSLEWLEDRLTPTVDITAFNVAAGTATFTGSSGGNNDLVLGESNGYLTHNLLQIGGTGQYASNTDFDPGPGVAQIAVDSGTSPLLIVNMEGANNTLTFDDSWTFREPVLFNGGTGGNETLISNDGDDTFQLSSVTSGTLNGNVNWSNVETLNGSSYNTSNTLIGENAARTWTITGNNTATYSDGSSTLNLINMSVLEGGGGNNTFNVDASVFVPLTLQGSGGNNIFNIADGVNFGNNLIDGGPGSNTLNYGAWTSGVIGELSNPGSIDGVAGTELVSGTQFDNIDVLTGSTPDSILVGENTASIWSLDSTSTYFDGTDTLTFSAFYNIIGGSAGNTFNVRPQLKPTTPWFIVGGASTGDTLNLELQSPPLSVPPTGGTLEVTGLDAGIYTSNEYSPVNFQEIQTFNPDAPIPNVIIDGTATSTDFRVVRNGTEEAIYDITGVSTGFPGNPYFSVLYSGIQTLTIKGTTAESNRVILDFGGSGSPLPAANSDPIPSGGFVFDGKAINDGSSTGTTDELDIGATSATGSPTPVTFGSVNVTYTAATAGSTTFTDTSSDPLGTVTVNNLDDYDLSGGPTTLNGGSASAYQGSTSIQDLSFTLPAAVGATFQDNGTPTDNISQLVTTSGPTAFVPTNFPDPSAALSVNTTAPGGDTVSLGSMDQGFHPTLINFTGISSTVDTYKLISPNFFQSPFSGVTLTSSTLDLNGTNATMNWLSDVPGASKLSLTSGAVLTAGDATSQTYNGQIVGSGGLIKQGSGSWTLGGTVDNTFSGTTNVNAGTLLLDKLSSVSGGVAVSGPLVIGFDFLAAPATARLLANNETQSVSPYSAVTVNTTGLFDVNGFTDTINTLTMERGSSNAAQVTIGAGHLILKGDVTLNSTGSGATTATITSSSTGQLDLGGGNPRNFTIAAGSTTSPSIDLAVNAVVSGSGSSLTKLGAGVLELGGSGNNTYTGTTTVNAGTLLLDQTSGYAVPAALVIGSDTLAVSATARLLANNQTQTASPYSAVTVNTTGLFDVNGFTDTINTLTMERGSSSAAQVTIGSGHLILNGDVTLNSTGSGATTATITSSSTGQLDLDGGNPRNFTIAAGSTTSPSIDLAVNAVVSGSGSSLTKFGAGVLELGGSGNNTYTGTTTVNAGTLLLGKTTGYAVPAALVIGSDTLAVSAIARLATNNQTQTASPYSAVTVNTTGVFDLASFTDTINTLTMESGTSSGGQVTLGSGTLTLGGDVTLLATGTGAKFASIGPATGQLNLGGVTRNFTIAKGTAAPANDLLVSAAMSNGGLTKLGAGILGLSGADTFTGQTTINGGTLNLTGSLTGATSNTVQLNASGVSLTGGGLGVINGRGVVVSAGSLSTTIQGLAQITNSSSLIGIDDFGGVSILSNGISGNGTGIQVESGGATATATGNTISSPSGGTGIYVTGVALPLTSITFGAGNSITGGAIGVQINGIDATVVGLTMNNTAFSGQTMFYITLTNNALVGPQILDASNASFNGVTGTNLTPTELNAVEALLHHYPEDSGVGLIILKTKYAVIGPDGNLLVIGTQSSDSITVNTTNPSNVTVTIDGTTIVNPAPLSNGIFQLAVGNRVIVFGLNGNDTIQTPGIRAAEIRCGTGNCNVYGSSENDVMVGGGGNNLFVDNGGSDVLVSGLGQSTMQANGAGRTLLIAGQVMGVAQTYANLEMDSAAFVASPSTFAASSTAATLVAATSKPATTANRDILSGGTGADCYLVTSVDLITNYSAAKGDVKIAIT